jgi:hypothetical protein
MTRASAARVERRIGRPLKDMSDDPDRISIEFALALQKAWGMSERMAFDFVIARFEAIETEPTKTPRGTSKKPGFLVGYETAPLRTVKGRALTLRKKIKRLPPRPDVVAALTMALQCRSTEAAHRLLEGLSSLAAVAGPDRLQRVLAELGRAEKRT